MLQHYTTCCWGYFIVKNVSFLDRNSHFSVAWLRICGTPCYLNNSQNSIIFNRSVFADTVWLVPQWEYSLCSQMFETEPRILLSSVTEVKQGDDFKHQMFVFSFEFMSNVPSPWFHASFWVPALLESLCFSQTAGVKEATLQSVRDERKV